MRLEVLVGGIAAGKSTYSAKRAAQAKGAIVCNDDAIVTAVHGGNYDDYTCFWKPLYKTIENTIVTVALGRGYDVLVDRGVNQRLAARRRFIGLAHSLDAEAVAVVFPRSAAAVHAQRRFAADSRGHSLAYWTAVAERHEQDYSEPTVAEGFDKIEYITWEDICGM